jgi:hypothetical protein
MQNERNFFIFLWKYKMFQQTNLTWARDSIEILHPGHTNTNAGPDFTDARIKIGDTLWLEMWRFT